MQWKKRVEITYGFKRKQGHSVGKGFCSLRHQSWKSWFCKALRRWLPPSDRTSKSIYYQIKLKINFECSDTVFFHIDFKILLWIVFAWKETSGSLSKELRRLTINKFLLCLYGSCFHFLLAFEAPKLFWQNDVVDETHLRNTNGLVALDEWSNTPLSAHTNVF